MARKMKDSGIEWIGEIPEGWTCKRGKQLFVETNERSKTGSEELLTVSHLTGVTPRSQKNVNMFMSESLVDYKVCHPGDLAANTMWMWQGAIGVSRFHGVISPSYNTYRQRTINYIPEYLDYLLRIRPLVDTYNAYSTGITLSRLRLYPQSFLSIHFIVPPMDEQQKIATYLDVECSRIDAMLAKTRDSIEEYKKLKQAVITQAVTKGVRGEREMKPTDFTRWSEIPFDWDLKRVKSCIASISSGLSAVTDDANSEESGEFVLRTSAVSSGFFVPTEVKPVLKSAVNRLICPVEPDTLIVSRMNTASMVGACAYVANNHPNTFLPDKLWKIKFLPSYHTKYMWYALNSVPAKSWFSELATGASSSMQNISINDFTSNYLPIPAFSEQKEIANYLDAKCAEIDGLVAKKEQLVKELESYKKSLIYEVVTGKREM